MPCTKPFLFASILRAYRISGFLFRPWFFLLLVLFLGNTFITSIHAQNSHKKNVLILNSYNYGYGWTDSIMKGIEAVLPQQDYNLTVEYMDTKRYEEPAYFQKLFDLYHYKFAAKKFDIIICSDDNAFNFLIKYKDNLFTSKMPVVFCGVNFFQDLDLKDRQDFTGVVENYDIAGTVKIIRNLQPNLKEILIISDRTTTGISNTLKAREVMAGQFPEQKYTLVDNVTMGDLLQILGRSPVGNVALYLGFTIDKTGKSYAPLEQSLVSISRHSKVPFYSVWEFTLESVVGGMITSGYYQGEMAARMAKRLLDGDNVAAIPVVKESPNRPMFNYIQMKRFGISLSQLPPGSTIINLPDSFYEENKSLVIGTIAVMAGLFIVIIVLITNINKRKQAEDALQVSNERLQLALKGADLGTWDWNVKTGAVTFNERWADMLGYSLNEVEPHANSWEKLVHPEDLPAIMDMLKAHLEGRTSFYETEHRLKHKSGQWIWALDKGKVIERDGEGKPVRACGTHLDITERKQAEEARREAEQQFRSIFDNATDGILILDPETKKFHLANPMIAQMLGYTQEELQHLGVIDIHPPDSLPQVLDQIERQERKEITVARDIPLLRKNGSVFYADISATHLNIKGKFFLMGLFRDITERKEKEEEIIRQREELRGLAARLTEVEEKERQNLARELHDQVCQNLANISIALETLVIRANREPLHQVLSRLADVSAVAEQTGEITRDIMENLRPTLLDHYGLEKALRQLGSQFSQRTGIDLEIVGEETDSRLNPDVELALFRIAQESLNNVAKHSRASHVVLAKEVDKGTVRLIVADNGIGFDQNIVADPKEGRGWGLMTMNERAMAVGGQCCIESQPGQGTRVIVEVPR